MGGFHKVRKRKNVHFALTMVFGIAVGLAIRPSSLTVRFLAAWDSAALLFVISTYGAIFLKGESISYDSGLEKLKAPYIDIILILVSIANIGAVGLMLFGSEAELLDLGLGLVSIAISWLLLHTVFIFLYIENYRREGTGSIDFNGCSDPNFWDFAYVSFTIGMTYQISDTNVHSSRIRRLVLRHALLSFLFGTSIISTSINLVAGLAGK